MHQCGGWRERIARMGEWDPELEERARRQRLAAAMGGEERVARQHANGRLTVRERIAQLLDDGSFREIGGLTRSSTHHQSGGLQELLPAHLLPRERRIDGPTRGVAGDGLTF